MNRRLVLLVFLLGTIASAGAATGARRATSGPQEFVMSRYLMGGAQVSIKSASGTLLTTLDVPPEIELSLHLLSGDQLSPIEAESFSVRGDVSIRMRPRAELRPGGLREQMLNAPLRLDVSGAQVSVVTKRPSH